MIIKILSYFKSQIKRFLFYLLLEDFKQELFWRIEYIRWQAACGESVLRFDYNLTESSLVLDLGGYKGDFAYGIYKRYSCNILVFEPHPVFFEECKKRFEKIPKIQVFNYGLSDANSDLFISDEQKGSSFYNNEGKLNNKGLLCKVRRYSDIIKELKINEIDLMKLNIEGAEFPLMEHIIQQNLTSNVKNFQIQYHHIPRNLRCFKRYIKISEQLFKTHTRTWCYIGRFENWQRNDVKKLN